MSHFTRIQTQMVEPQYITRALSDMGYAHMEGITQIRGYGGQITSVDIKVPTRSHDYDIGLRKSGGFYEIVADWWGIREIEQKDFTAKLSQGYAYHAAKAKLEAQGFALVTEETKQNGQIHLVLRRMA
jgi:Protein of unknown function (DUF1257)